MRVLDVRNALVNKYVAKEFVSGTVELAPVMFVADEETIIGTPNPDYIARELEWYYSQSLNVNDIPGETPAIWKKCATPDGRINSNYGWAIYSNENGNQYTNALWELRRDPNSRRALMIYTRPSMHTDQNKDGMQDFMCTSTVQYLVRNGRLDTVVNMRSNDAVFGYNNDWAWQKHVQEEMATDLGLEVGDLHWCAGSLHVYERHYKLLEELASSSRPR